VSELGRLSAGLAATGGVALAGIGIVFLRDPAAGLRLATHRAVNLPEVMANRYLGFAVLAVLAAWHGDGVVIAALFAGLGLMACHDAAIYARAGHDWTRHAGVGAVSFAVAALAWLARAEGV